jgi:hypothetical protein
MAPVLKPRRPVQPPGFGRRACIILRTQQRHLYNIVQHRAQHARGKTPHGSRATTQ